MEFFSEDDFPEVGPHERARAVAQANVAFNDRIKRFADKINPYSDKAEVIGGNIVAALAVGTMTDFKCDANNDGVRKIVLKVTVKPRRRV